MNIKYLYVRNDYRNRDITIVSDLFDRDGKTFVKCAWSFRNKKDNFIKREGRKIALERLQNNDPNYSDVFEIEPDKVKFFNIATKILARVFDNVNTPKMYKQDIFEDMEYFSYMSEENQSKIKDKWNSIKEILN